MQLEQIHTTPTYTRPVPAFSFLFAYAEATPKRRLPNWLSRPGLRSKRV